MKLPYKLTAVFVWLMLIFFQSTSAQAPKSIDSLLVVLQNNNPSSLEKARIYRQIMSYYWLKYKPDSIIHYANLCLEISEKIKNDSLISIGYEFLGYAYQQKENRDSMIYFYRKALDVAQKNNDQDMIACVYMDIGTYYGYGGDYTTSLDYFQKAAGIYEKSNKILQYVRVLTNVGVLYHRLELLDKAIETNESINKTLDLMDTTKLSAVEKLYVTDVRVSCDYELANCYISKGLPEKTIEYALKTIEESKKYNQIDYEILAHQLLSQAYYRITPPDFEKSEEHIKISLNLFDANPQANPLTKRGGYYTLSNIYREQKKFKLSEEYALKARQISSTDNALETNILYNLLIANIFMNNHEKAVDYFQKYVATKDSIHSKEYLDSFTNQEVKYETEKKELRITALEKQRKLYIWLGITCLALIVTLLVLYINFRRFSQQKIRQLMQEKQLAAAEAVIEGETAERTRLARDLHDGLGGMLSAVKINLNDIEQLQNARDMLDSSIEELRRVAHHLMPASLLRFGMKASLEDFCNAFPNVHFHYFGEDRRIAEKTEILVYRCV
ncbi:MAG: tetratricopeptide repeat protein, partial [Dysgonamonadaceae bacterium]|nr:tetratricopeptide repeat protein [Dysgonamonadaceae bacterium]